MEFVQMSTIHGTEGLAHELGALTADLPRLIALPILLNACVFTSERGGPRSVASSLGLPEERYRVGCLTGFGRASECMAAVGQRVLDVLTNQAGLSSNLVGEAVILWLKVEMAPTSPTTT